MFPIHFTRVRLDKLKAYDSHCNLVLGDVEETIYVVEDDDEAEEDTIKVSMLPVRPAAQTEDHADGQEAIRDAVCSRLVMDHRV